MVIGIDGSRAFTSQRTGTENYSYHMLRALAEVDKKNEYRVYLRTQSSQLTTHNFPSNFAFTYIPWPRLFTQGGLAMKSWTDHLDLLWVPAHTLPVLGKPNLPTIVTIHGVEFEHLPGAYRFGQNLHLTWSTRWAVHRAKKIVSVSEKTKQDLIDWLHVDPGKIEVIHEGVDLKKFQISKPRMRHGAYLHKHDLKMPYILFVGTIQPRKNLIRLIKAFSLLIKTYNLVIAGKHGWDYQQIIEAPQKYGVGDRVKFLGYVPDQDLPALYQNAALYVEPSLQEGFGLPVLEAMAAGIPVIAANAGALPEIAGNAAILVNPHSTISIAHGLAIGLGAKLSPAEIKNSEVKLPSGVSNLRGSSLRSTLVERGHARVSQFTWRKASKQLIKLFNEVSDI